MQELINKLLNLQKIHKPLVNGFPKLRPILSALNTGTYKWAKFFVPLLRHLTSNEFTLKDSFEFEQDTGLFMASLDVDSLFTNVPLEETINICVNELFKSNSNIHGLNKKQITEMLWMQITEIPGMTLKYWGGSLIIGFWRLRRVYLLKEIDLRLIRIFTPRNCFYFSFMMSIINFNSSCLLLFDTFFVNLAVC